jgi:hypothetical protein
MRILEASVTQQVVLYDQTLHINKLQVVIKFVVEPYFAKV